MDAIEKQIGVMMTYGLLRWGKQGFSRFLGSGYYLLILWGEMRSGFSLMREVYGYRDFCYRPYIIKNGLPPVNCMQMLSIRTHVS